jgi:hypothetical protein
MGMYGLDGHLYWIEWRVAEAEARALAYDAMERHPHIDPDDILAAARLVVVWFGPEQKLADIEPYIRQRAVELGLDPDEALAEARAIIPLAMPAGAMPGAPYEPPVAAGPRWRQGCRRTRQA